MVISGVNTVTYNGDGITTAWPYTFPVTDDSEIRVQLNNADGTAVIIESDYYVDLVNSTVYYPGYAPGSEPPEADQPPKVQDGQTITVYREIPITQEADLGEKWPFEVIEKGLDKLTMIAQQIDSGTKRTLDNALASIELLADVVVDSDELQHITDQLNSIDTMAGEASDSADAAADSADEAADGADEAADYAALAKKWANYTDGVVDDNEYSAKKYATDASNSADAAADSAADAQNLYDALIAQGGHPFQAATIAAMTDTTKIYVYTGSEAGYTSGNWYYYNGSNWVSGGVYNAVSFTTDTTLTVSGAAADAKVTGDKISDIDNALLSLYIPSPAWTIYASGLRAHKELGTGINAIMCVDPVVNGVVGVVGFADDTYSGTRQYDSDWLRNNISLSNLNPALYYQVFFQTNPQTTLNQTTVDTVVVKYSCGLIKAEEEVTDVTDEINAIDSVLRRTRTLTSQLTAGGYITTNLAIGSTVDFTPTSAGNYAYIVYECKYGDKFTLYGRGGNAPRLWAITDTEKKLTSVAASSLDVSSTDPLTINITASGYFIMNCNTNIAHILSLSRLEAVDTEHVEAVIEATDEEKFTDMATIDRFLMSSDIKNVFTTDVSNLPAHPCDADNGYYSSITVSEMYALWDDLVTAYSDELTMTELGLSSDGVNQLRVYKFTPKTVAFKYKPFRPKIMVTCATHGWEKSGTETLLMLLKMMFDSWYLDPVLETLRWDVDWVIVPIVNPYGFNNNTRKNANNVDINRNYAQGWAMRTYDTSSSTYQGAAALDQPESTIVNNLMISEKPDIGIDFHDFGGNETRLDWAEYEPNRILSAHIAQIGLDRVNRHIVRQFAFMSGVDPTAASQVSETQIVGKTVNAFYGNDAKIAYTFETCGELTYEPSKKRFNDNHALACIEMFSNFVAEILTEMYRSGFTKTAIVVEE